MSLKFRAPAVPLVTVDPYFSVWSGADNLYDDHTRHWTGARNGMVGLILIDGRAYRFIGKTEVSGRGEHPFSNKREPAGMEQVSLDIMPLSSVYKFKAAGICLEVDFTTPLLPYDLDLVSRPVSYVSFKVDAIDKKEHDVKIYFDVTAEWCTEYTEFVDNKVVWNRKEMNTHEDLYMGNFRQNILGRKGDDVRIDWGYFHLVLPDCKNKKGYINSAKLRKKFNKEGIEGLDNDYDIFGYIHEDMPVMAAVIDFNRINEKNPGSDYLILAYDDIYSIEYFKEFLPAYWRRTGLGFDEMLLKAISQYKRIIQECDKFNKELYDAGMASGGEKYYHMLSLAYRQAFAAHKLVADMDGKVLFISKECFSNGCAATVDVTYPSIPMFLLYNAELVKGMVRPVFKYAQREEWTFEFAPHDVGRYPVVNGQVYKLKGKWITGDAAGTNSGGAVYCIDKEASLMQQMPVEECGNMLIITAAISLVEGKTDFALEFWDLLTQWAEYLLLNGFDPGEQLSTDDFAGKLAHNSNLSIKAIIGIACYSLLCEMTGKNDKADIFMKAAREMSVRWEEEAREDDHYKLTFTDSGTWSLKYNMIWDDIFNFHLFPEAVKEKEIGFYKKMKNKYGTPLDSRDVNTKADWLIWAAALCKDKESFKDLSEPLWDFLNESPSRVPFTDFYGTTDRLERSMHHRSVVGGIFIKLLKDRYCKS